MKRVTDFYLSSGIETRIKFVYYAATDFIDGERPSTEPKTREFFRSVPVVHRDGQSKREDDDFFFMVRGKPNFFYVYTRDNLRLLTATTKSAVAPYNVSNSKYEQVIHHHTPEESAQVPVNVQEPGSSSTHEIRPQEFYVGNHVDFAVIRQRTPGCVLFKTHRTAYSVDVDTLHALDRDVDECNFRWYQAQPKSATELVCETLTGERGEVEVVGRPEQVYKNATEYYAFKLLFSVATDQLHTLTTHMGGGSSSSSSSSSRASVFLSGKHRRVYPGRKAQPYVMINRRRVYVYTTKVYTTKVYTTKVYTTKVYTTKVYTTKVGSRRSARGGGGGSNDILTDEMLVMCQEGLFAPIKARCRGLSAVQLIHDTANELGQGNSDTVIVLYDFVEPDRSVRFELDVSFLRDVYASMTRQRRGKALKYTDRTHLEDWVYLRDRIVKKCVEAFA